MWSFFAKVKDPEGELCGMSFSKKKKIFFKENAYVPMAWLWRYVKPVITISSFNNSSSTCYSENSRVLVCYPISVRFRLFGFDISDMDSLGYLYTGTGVDVTIVLVKPIDFHTVPLTKAEFFKHAQCIERKEYV